MSADVAETGVAVEELKQFIERIETIEEEIAAGNEAKREIYAEAKGRGFDTKVMKVILRMRKQDHAERQEHESILELYLSALGMA